MIYERRVGFGGERRENERKKMKVDWIDCQIMNRRWRLLTTVSAEPPPLTVAAVLGIL